MRVYASGGYFSKQPIFDNIFLNYVNDINPDAANQTVTAAEVGYGYFDGKINASINAYYTVWGNRQYDQSIQNDLGQDILYIFDGVSQTHSGLEIELDAKINKLLTLNAMASLGNWVYSSDFTATGTNTDTQVSEGSLTIYGDGLKVGDAAQTTLSAGLVLTPMKDLSLIHI